MLSESSAYSQRRCLCVFSVYENRHNPPYLRAKLEWCFYFQNGPTAQLGTRRAGTYCTPLALTTRRFLCACSQAHNIHHHLTDSTGVRPTGGSLGGGTAKVNRTGGGTGGSLGGGKDRPSSTCARLCTARCMAPRGGSTLAAEKSELRSCALLSCDNLRCPASES